MSIKHTTGVLEQIIQRTGHVSDIMSQLAVASEEQAATSNEMARNVSSISTTVEQSAGGVSDIAQVVDGLQQQAEELQSLMGQFEIGAVAPLASSSSVQLHSRRQPALHA
jgi:methyl-accepting chemotaxis protein